VVLTLDAHGGARACRGQRHRAVYDDGRLPRPGEHHFSEVREEREQQGMRGYWSQRGPWIRVSLDLDDDVCAPIRRDAATPNDRWELECLPLRLAPRVTSPALACRFAKGSPRTSFYAVGGVVAEPWHGDWILLAGGLGVAVEAHDRWHVSMNDWFTRIADARARVEEGAWQSKEDLGVPAR
jgi:hypothetical protein